MTKKIIFSIILVVFSIEVLAAEDIHVGIMWGNDIALNSDQKTLKAMQYEGFLNLALVNSGILDRDFATQAVQTTIPMNPASRDTRQLLDWMVEKNQDTNSVIRQARDNAVGTDGGLDVMILVSHTVKDRDSTCGYAELALLSVSVSNSETHAFGGVLEIGTCFAKMANTFAHELGHILYSEHEIDGFDDDNDDLSKPSKENHGLIASSGQRSIMVGGHAEESTAMCGAFVFKSRCHFNRLLTFSALHLCVHPRIPLLEVIA